MLPISEMTKRTNVGEDSRVRSFTGDAKSSVWAPDHAVGVRR